MGTVFRAEDRLMKQQVALKRVVIAPPSAENLHSSGGVAARQGTRF